MGTHNLPLVSYTPPQRSETRFEESLEQAPTLQEKIVQEEDLVQLIFTVPKKKPIMGKKGIKIFLFIVNTLFFIIGLVVFSIGVWTTSDKIFLSDIIGSNLYAAASYMLIISGFIILVVAVFGCVTTWKEMRYGILLYFVILSLIFIFMIVASILAVVFRGELQDVMSKAMGETIQKQYGVNIQHNEENQAITKSWDETQQKLHCCGVENEGWEIYQESLWYRNQKGDDKPFVPESCCKNVHVNRIQRLKQCQKSRMGPPGTPSGAKNDYLFYQGCYDAGYKFVMDQAGLLLAIGFSFSVILIAGLVLSMCLYRFIQRPPNEEEEKSAPL